MKKSWLAEGYPSVGLYQWYRLARKFGPLVNGFQGPIRNNTEIPAFVRNDGVLGVISFFLGLLQVSRNALFADRIFLLEPYSVEKKLVS